MRAPKSPDFLPGSFCSRETNQGSTWSRGDSRRPNESHGSAGDALLKFLTYQLLMESPEYGLSALSEAGLLGKHPKAALLPLRTATHRTSALSGQRPNGHILLHP